MADINKKDEFLVLLTIILNIFLISIIHLVYEAQFGWIVIIAIILVNLIIIVATVMDENKKSDNEKKAHGVWPYLLPVLFMIFGLICIAFIKTAADTSGLIMLSIFFILIGIVFLTVFKSIMLILGQDTTYYLNRETRELKSKDEFIKISSDDEKKKYALTNLGFDMLLYKIIRTIALSAFVFSNLWILSISPFSFFGGSLYGGIMQLILGSCLGLLLISFWTSANKLGLILVAGGCFAVYMLSFMFPTLFANLWIFSTTSSASAGISAVSGFGSISPMSYYKSTYIVRTGQTEKRMGPTYELISDDVVSLKFAVQGRLCDESILVASVNIQNLAKFELKDLSVQLSALRSPYCLGVVESDNPYNICNICGVNFTSTKSKGSTHTEAVPNLPKGVPKTVNVPFTTWLPADVMNQICKIRSNVLVHYHTTSVFPLSFIDYDAYLISPKNIGNPVSTSSFGKVLLSMDVGQQPVVVNDDTKSNDQVLLKLAWSQKGGGIVNTPKIVLYLPSDLGKCGIVNIGGISYTGSLGTTYSGLYGYNVDKTQLVNTRNFDCYNFYEMKNISPNLNVTTYCNDLFTTNINSTLYKGQGDVAKSLLYFTPSYSSSFEGMPSFNDACQDLATKNYTICVANRDIVQNDVLLCPLNLGGLDVSIIDLSTYLIRADALYSFNNIQEDQFTVENCNAI